MFHQAHTFDHFPRSRVKSSELQIKFDKFQKNMVNTHFPLFPFFFPGRFSTPSFRRPRRRLQVLTRLQKLTPRVRAVQGGLAQVLKEAKAYLAPQAWHGVPVYRKWGNTVMISKWKESQ